MAADPPHTPAPPPAITPHKIRRRTVVFQVVIVVGLLLVAAYVSLPRLYVADTDDAYVDAHIVSIVPKVSAYVTMVHVDDNSKIQADAPLIELDQRDFKQAVDIAVAAL